MPIFSFLAKNAALAAMTPAVLSLHTAYDGAGGNEVVGGTPAYARVPVTWLPPVNGTMSINGTYQFDVPATTVAWVGMWDAFAGYLGMVPAGGDAERPFAVDDLVADTLKSAAHGFILNDTLVAWGGSAGFLPAGLAEGVVYYVVTVLPDSLQISDVLGGAPVTMAVTGNGFLQRIMPVTYVSQAVFPLSALTLDATIAG